MNFQSYLNTALKWATSSGLKVLLILILVLILIKISSLVSKRLLKTMQKRTTDFEFHKRAETLGSVIHHIIIAAIWVTGIMMILPELGLQIGPILAAVGVLGLAVGFGAQSLVKDMIGGFFILLEDQIRVGDVVEIAGKGGLVEKINLRMVVIRDVAGNVHYIPNGEISVVTNMTKEYSRYVFSIGVAYREDVDEVIEVIKSVDVDLRGDPLFSDDILQPIEILGLDEFADSAIIIKARTTTKPIQQWRIGREFNRRLKIAFDEKGIEIPFPHVTFYAGVDKDGKAAPLNIRTEQGKPEE